ncbi:MAG: hypothetical protein WC489_06255 [Patescibacteria group bacterium]
MIMVNPGRAPYRTASQERGARMRSSGATYRGGYTRTETRESIPRKTQPPKPKTMLIKAEHQKNGWVLVAEDGTLPYGHHGHRTRKEAYVTAQMLWPPNGVWEGKRVSGGYRIVL